MVAGLQPSKQFLDPYPRPPARAAGLRAGLVWFPTVGRDQRPGDPAPAGCSRTRKSLARPPADLRPAFSVIGSHTPGSPAFAPRFARAGGVTRGYPPQVLRTCRPSGHSGCSRTRESLTRSRGPKQLCLGQAVRADFSKAFGLCLADQWPAKKGRRPAAIPAPTKPRQRRVPVGVKVQK